MKTLVEILPLYAAFEQKTQDSINKLFGAFCADCLEPCCRVDICEEGRDSLFLQALRKSEEQALDMSEELGYLDLKGCCLTCGRPPVCSEFLCDSILGQMPNEFQSYIAQVLCSLINWIGDSAYESVHLCEITQPSHLAQVDWDRIEARIKEADLMYDSLSYFTEHGRLGRRQAQLLHKVIPLPRCAPEFVVSL